MADNPKNLLKENCVCIQFILYLKCIHINIVHSVVTETSDFVGAVCGIDLPTVNQKRKKDITSPRERTWIQFLMIMQKDCPRITKSFNCFCI